MDFNSSTMQGIDIDFDPISESEIEDLIGNASSELQDLACRTFRLGQTDPENHVQSAGRNS